MSRKSRQAMIDRQGSKLSLVRQCSLLDISRGSVYYRPTPTRPGDLELMALMDRRYLKTPFYGSRRIRVWLSGQGHLLGRDKARRLMRLAGLEAVFRRPNTSKATPEHRVYPYLLRGMTIDRVNQVWTSDITYIPMRDGFLYLVAVMDWYSRYVIAWRLSNSMDAEFCVDVLKDALSQGTPEIFNTDQGAQFTCREFTDTLKSQDVAISMDGKGRAIDNVMIERLWRTVKYEEVYLQEYNSGTDCYKGLGAYLDYYRFERRHQSLERRTPWEAYRPRRAKRAKGSI